MKRKLKSTAQTNNEKILVMQGDMKLLRKEICVIKDNHLKHLDYKITQIQKVMWVIFTAVIFSLVHSLNIIG
jgi:L-lactate utilization protein LutB|tara:strand:+ start:291 stop:506 length:216 start_codon:yes stop_codon:yes gene_type:complete